VELEKANHPRSSRLIALTPGPSADAYEYSSTASDYKNARSLINWFENSSEGRSGSNQSNSINISGYYAPAGGNIGQSSTKEASQNFKTHAAQFQSDNQSHAQNLAHFAKWASQTLTDAWSKCMEQRSFIVSIRRTPSEDKFWILMRFNPIGTQYKVKVARILTEGVSCQDSTNFEVGPADVPIHCTITKTEGGSVAIKADTQAYPDSQFSVSYPSKILGVDEPKEPLPIATVKPFDTPGGASQTFTCPDGMFVTSCTSILSPSGSSVCVNSIQQDGHACTFGGCNQVKGQQWRTNVICAKLKRTETVSVDSAPGASPFVSCPAKLQALSCTSIQIPSGSVECPTIIKDGTTCEFDARSRCAEGTYRTTVICGDAEITASQYGTTPDAPQTQRCDNGFVSSCDSSQETTGSLSCVTGISQSKPARCTFGGCGIQAANNVDKGYRTRMVCAVPR
jgi:hypothetical protein